MPSRDQSEWILRFFEVHQSRFSAMRWPKVDSEEFDEMVASWLYHFRREKVTQDRANKASLALMMIKHYPNNHMAEFFACMPEPPVDYIRVDPVAVEHWKRGDGRHGLNYRELGGIGPNRGF